MTDFFAERDVGAEGSDNSGSDSDSDDSVVFGSAVADPDFSSSVITSSIISSSGSSSAAELADAQTCSEIERRACAEALANVCASYVNPAGAAGADVDAAARARAALCARAQDPQTPPGVPLGCAVAEPHRVVASWDTRARGGAPVAAVLCGHRAVRHARVAPACVEARLALPPTGAGEAVFAGVGAGVHVVCLVSNNGDGTVLAESAPVTVGAPLSLVRCTVLSHAETETDSVLAVEYAAVAAPDALARGDSAAVAAERAAFRTLVAQGAFLALYRHGAALAATPAARERLADWPMGRVHLRLPLRPGSYECRLAVETAASSSSSTSTTSSPSSTATTSTLATVLPYRQMCAEEVVVASEDAVSVAFAQRPVASADLRDSCAATATAACVRWTCRRMCWAARPWVGVFERSAVAPCQALARCDAALCRTSLVSGVAHFDLSEYGPGEYAFAFFARAQDPRPAAAKKFRLPL